MTTDEHSEHTDEQPALSDAEALDIVDETEEAQTDAVEPRIYKKPHEIRAARRMHGADYDRLVAEGTIDAPSREELPDADLADKLAADDEERTAHSEKRAARHAHDTPSAKKAAAKSAKRSARKRSR